VRMVVLVRQSTPSLSRWSFFKILYFLQFIVVLVSLLFPITYNLGTKVKLLEGIRAIRTQVYLHGRLTSPWR
jgi:hypothetical protein